MGEGREWPSGVQLFGDPLFIGVLCIGYVHTKNGASEGNGSAHLTFELICWALPYLLDSFPHPATGAKRTYRAVSRSASRQTGRRGTRCSFLFFFCKVLANQYRPTDRSNRVVETTTGGRPWVIRCTPKWSDRSRRFCFGNRRWRSMPDRRRRVLPNPNTKTAMIRSLWRNQRRSYRLDRGKLSALRWRHQSVYRHPCAQSL